MNLYAENKSKPMVARSDWLPFYNVRSIGAKHLLTNRMGNWELLGNEEFTELNNVFVDKGLLDRLSRKMLIIDHANQSKLVNRQQEYSHKTLRGPYLFIVHLTQRCNLTCSYCHSSAISVNAKGKDLTTPVATKIAEFISKVNVPEIHIAFQGGEPLLMTDVLDEFCEEVNRLSDSKKISYYVTTNGTHYNDKIKALIEKHNLGVCVSVDGTKKTHDLIRLDDDGNGSYERAVKTRMEIAESNIGSGVGSTLVLTRQTASQWQSFIDNYVELGQRMIHLKPVTKLGGAKGTWNENGLEFDEFWEIYEKAIRYMIEQTSKGQIVVEKTVSFALEKVLGGKDTMYVDHRNPCGLVYGVLNFDIDGKIYACHEGKRNKRFLLGSANDSPEDVLFSNDARRISSASVLDKHQVCRGCSYLPYCGPCPAHDAQQTGKLDVRPHESWHCKFTLKLYDLVFDLLESQESCMEAWHEYNVY